jgi:acyl-CoA thioesterase FadM
MIDTDQFASWWSVDRQLWWRDFDYLGHFTAASYAVLYEEACGALLTEAWNVPEPSYVVARLDISYLREVRRDDSPVRVYVRPNRVGRSGFSVEMVVCSASGVVCSTAVASYVAWDRAGRTSRPMTEAERAGLTAQS